MMKNYVKYQSATINSTNATLHCLYYLLSFFIIIDEEVIEVSIGERIRELRKKYGLSQEQLADKLNVSRQAIQKWESNVNEPNIETIKCIACYFQVDFEYLLNGKALAPLLKDVNEKNERTVLNETKHSNITIYYILLIFSILILLICFIWSLIDKRSNPTLGEGFYTWYIPFYSSDAELIVFQILNIVGIIGIVVSLIKVIKIK